MDYDGQTACEMGVSKRRKEGRLALGQVKEKACVPR